MENRYSPSPLSYSVRIGKLSLRPHRSPLSSVHDCDDGGGFAEYAVVLPAREHGKGRIGRPFLGAHRSQRWWTGRSRPRTGGNRFRNCFDPTLRSQGCRQIYSGVASIVASCSVPVRGRQSPRPRFQKSYCFPASGITARVPGNSCEIFVLNQATAGGSPCTKITTRGEIFRI